MKYDFSKHFSHLMKIFSICIFEVFIQQRYDNFYNKSLPYTHIASYKLHLWVTNTLLYNNDLEWLKYSISNCFAWRYYSTVVNLEQIMWNNKWGQETEKIKPQLFSYLLATWNHSKFHLTSHPRLENKKIEQAVPSLLSIN